MRKICIISGAWPETRCGVGDYTMQLARQLSRMGEQITILTTQHQEVIGFDHLSIRATIKHWKISRFLNIMQELKTINPEIIHIQYPSVGYGRGLAINAVIPLAKLFLPKVKTVLTLHEFDVFTWRGRLRLWFSMKLADQVVFTNYFDQSQAREKVGSINSQVIPIGNNLAAKNEVKEVKLQRSGQITLIHFGTIMPNKGWEVMIDALVQLKKMSYNVRLIAIASLEPEKYKFHKDIKLAIKQADVKNEIVITGYLSKEAIDKEMEKDSIIVMPFKDGLKLNRGSFIAMLGYAKPIITTVPAMPLEGIIENSTCKFIPGNNAKALAETIIDLWHNPEVCRFLAQGAFKASALFDWKIIGEKTTKLYNELK